MNPNLKFQTAVVALILVVALMGALIALTMLNSQRQVATLAARFDQLDSESPEIEEHFKDTFRDMNDKMLRYRTIGDANSWKDFLDAEHKMQFWIDSQKAKLDTPEEGAILGQVDAAFGDYLQKAKNLHARMQESRDPTALPPDLTDSLTQSRRQLFDLIQNLTDAHFDLRQQVLSQVGGDITRLRLVIFELVSLLFVFGVVLAAMVYLNTIKPLRLKLVESETLAQQREKLASLGLLAANVAHEIRNPLTAIKATLFTQKRKLRAGMPQLAEVEFVEREILRLERIVNDFLQFAKPAEPKLAVLEVDAVFLDLQRFFAPQLSQANIQLIMESLAPMQVRADAAQLKQALINLVQNAAESIGHDGRITLQARPDRGRLVNGEMPVVILEVTDTGKGIAPEVERRLFDPFFTTKENGTGLGLSIAMQIVQKHGGELRYQTQINHGTTFGIVLQRVME